MLSEEALRVARRMAAGEMFYASLSPRLSPIVRDQLRAAGLEIQSESPRHESTFFYPLHKDKFTKQLESIEKTHNECEVTESHRNITQRGGARKGAGRPKKPDAKKTWARKLSPDVIAYMDSTPNAVETLETTIRNSKGYKQWKRDQ